MTGPDALPHVFLSHNSRDKEFVEPLAKAIEAKGLKCFLDKWDLRPAGNWLRSLEDALRKCKFFVLFIGPNGLGPYHQAELDVALQRQIQERRNLIIPVLLPGATPKVLEGISVFLTSIQALEFRGRDDECALNFLIGLLNGADSQYLRDILKQHSAPSYLFRSIDDWFNGLTIDWKGNVCEVAIGLGEKCLTIPFKSRQARRDNVASQLEWNYELTGFMGRERELEQLQRWADSDYPIDIQPIVGEGGVGKTRLAFEFASRLRQQGWQAGEAGQTFKGSWFTGRAGILLVIDYPEHRSENVMQLLEALDDLENPSIKLRILLITRHADFAEHLSQRARALIRPALQLNGFSETHTQWELLQAAWKSLDTIEYSQSTTAAPVKELSVKALPVDETAFSQWIARDDFHRNPLIILALAAYLFSDTPENFQSLLDINGREVVRELTLREIKRINKEIPKEFQKGTILIKALAAITGGLDLQQCAALLNTLKTQSITPAAPDLNQLLEYSIVTNDCIQPLSPDIFAADFLIHALKEYAKLHSTQWQLAVLAFKENRLQNWSRLGRLVFDAQYKLEYRWPIQPLADAVVQHKDLCDWVANEFVYLEPREIRLNPIGIVALKKIIAEGGIEDALIARFNSHLSNLLAETGDRAGSLEASQQAAQIYDKLAKENFSIYGPYLAGSLNNFSVELAKAGNRVGALTSIKRAVEIYRVFQRENFREYAQYYADSLSNLSNRLAESSDNSGALNASEEAVVVYQQLANQNFKKYGPKLAVHLNNLSASLGENGFFSRGVSVSQNTVKICHQLAEENFSAYGAILADGLINLSWHFRHIGDINSSLEKNRQSAEILKQLYLENNVIYGPRYALSLDSLSVCLFKIGDNDGGLEAIQRAVEIREQIAKENFSAYGEDLCISLFNQFFYFKKDISLLNKLWQVHQQIKHFSDPYFEGSFAAQVENMLTELREQGDNAMVAKLQEIHDTLTKPQT